MARRKSSRQRNNRSSRKRMIWAPFESPGQQVLTIDDAAGQVVSPPVLMSAIEPPQLGNFAEYTVMATNYMTAVAAFAAPDDGNPISVWVGATLLDPELIAAERASPGSQTLPGFWIDTGGQNEQVSVEPWFWLQHHWLTLSNAATAPTPTDLPGLNSRTGFFPGKSKRVVEQGEQVGVIAQAGRAATSTANTVVNVALDGRTLLQYSP